MSQILIRTCGAVATILLAASVSLAHARLESSIPAPGSTLAAAPIAIKLRFNAGVQPAMSSIKVFAISSGMVVPVGPLESADEGKGISASLPEIDAGSYRVEWRALSADDHMVEGRFEFRVESTSTERLAGSEPAGQDGQDHSTHEVESAIRWPQVLIRWLIYLGMMLLTGGLSFRLFVADEALVGTGSFDARLIVILAAASAFLLLGLLVALALQARILTGAVDPFSAISVLRETSFGLPWMMQAVSVFVSLILIGAARSVSKIPRKVLLSAAFALSLVTLLGSSLSGHARAASNEYSFAIFSDWLHLASASIWIGGVFVIGSALAHAIRGIGHDAVNERLATWIRRFTRVAIPATILLALSGLYNSWIHVDSFAALVETSYGRVLLTKVGIAGTMVLLGSINGLVLERRLRVGSTQSRGTTETKLFRNVRVEGLLAIAVLFLAALLAFLPPAREHLPQVTGRPISIDDNAK